MLVLIYQEIMSQENIILPSPQTYSFVQYGDVPVNHFTGEASFTVPIYTYEDRDFKIPVYLGYNSSGFKPTKREGIVGLDWFLNAGGTVMRTVNGEPDDHEGNPTGILHGFYYGVKESSGFRSLTKSQIMNLTYSSSDLLKYAYNSFYELQPDKFTFKAPGLEGSFYINNDGTVTCEGNRKFVVNITQLSIQPYNARTLNPSSIVITNDKGYTYYFGGTVQNLEFDQPLTPSYKRDGFNHGGLTTRRKTPTIIAWHLTKIVAPNGRAVVYRYRPFTEPQDYTASDNEHYIFHKTYIYRNLTHFRKSSLGGGITSQVATLEDTDGHSYGATKTVYLDAIIIGDATIKFDYSNKPNKFYSDTEESSSFNQYNLKLDNIRILYNNDDVRNFFFDYETYGNRLFLGAFGENGNGEYSFTYNTSGYIFPSTITKGVDRWGFWNGRDSDRSIVPFAHFDADGNESYDSSDSTRTSSENYSKAAMLKEVVYPTGGITKFKYQSHDYSLRLERRNDHDFLPYLYNVNSNAGGVRIKEITNYKSDGQTILSGKKYDYKKEGTSLSSGVLMEWPEYYLYTIMTAGASDLDLELLISGNNIWSNHFPGEKYIQYSEVKESPVVEDNTYTWYYYNSYETTPDLAEYSTFITNQTVYNHIPANLKAYSLSYPGIMLTDLSDGRGKLLKIKKYGYINNAQKKLEETSYEYTGYSDNPDLYIAAVQGTGYAAHSYKIRYAHNLLKKITNKIYSTKDNTSVSTIKEYNYYDFGIKKMVTEHLSNGDLLQTYYRYPFDIPEGELWEPTCYPSMIAKNMIDYPVERIRRRNGKVADGYLTPYKRYGSFCIAPSKEFILEMSRLGGYSFDYYKGLDHKKDSRYGEGNIYDYDSKGNLVEYRKSGGIITYFVYGYNNLYPVAKIESRTSLSYLSDVRSSISNHNFTTNTSTEVNYLKSQFSSYINSPDCLVTLYTYAPLVGITSETLSNGLTTYYKYDTFGRLHLIKNDDGEITDRYNYNYKQ